MFSAALSCLLAAASGAADAQVPVLPSTPLENIVAEAQRTPVLTAEKRRHLRRADSLAAMRMEMPKLKGDADERFLVHRVGAGHRGDSIVNLSIGYDARWHHPRWVAFRFDEQTRPTRVKRSGQFKEDPLLAPRERLTGGAYKGTGYDRGHLVASSDRLYSLEANKQTFYMTNMTPQVGAFNQKYWIALERLVQDLGRNASFADTLYVVKGGAINKESDFARVLTVEGKKLPVPRHNFMALLKIKNGKYSAVGFWLENKDYGHAGRAEEMAKHAMSIEQLEQLTDIDFFHNLPDDVERRVETSFSPNDWGLKGGSTPTPEDPKPHTNPKNEAIHAVEALYAVAPAEAEKALRSIKKAKKQHAFENAVGRFYAAIDGKSVYLADASGNGAHYLTFDEKIAPVATANAAQAERDFVLRYDENSREFSLTHRVTGRHIATADGVTLSTSAERESAYTLPWAGQRNHLAIRMTGVANKNFLSRMTADADGVSAVGRSEQNSAGTTWVVSAADDVTEKQILDAAKLRFEHLGTHELGDELGQYGAVADAYATDVQSAESGTASIALYRKLINAAADGTLFKLNLPKAGDFLRIKTQDGQKSLSSPTTSSTETPLEVQPAADANSVFYFDGTHLVAFAEGLALAYGNNGDAAHLTGATATPAEVSFKAGKEKSYVVNIAQGSESVALHTDGESVEYASAADGASPLKLESVKQLSVTTNAEGYAALFSPVALKVSGATIHVTDGYDEQQRRLGLAEVHTDVIPAGSAVVLVASPNTTITLTPTDETGVAVSDTLLTGAALPSTAATDKSVFELSGDGVQRVTDAHLRAFRAFFSPNDVTTTQFTFIQGHVTALSHATAAQRDDKPIYDLQGRRVRILISGRIYLQGGQKFIYK